MERLILIITTLFLVYGGLCLSLFTWQSRLIFFPSAALQATPADRGLAYQEVWIAVGNDVLHGWWIPAAIDAPAVLYLHGNSSNIGDVVAHADRFHRLGLAVLLIDYRGYGRSQAAFPTETSVYEDAAAAWHYLTQVQQLAPERIFLYGHSLGGAIAIELATHQPQAAGVIVESSFTSLAAMVESTSPSLLPKGLLTQRFDSLTKVRSLHPPLLLIHGTADRTIPVAMSQALFAATTAPKQLLLVPGAGHTDTAEIGDKGYTETMEGFLRQALD